jgi:hypothetical protein
MFGIKASIRASICRAVPRNRAAARISAARAPCFQGAARQRANPSAVLAPVEAPPCLWHRPFRMAGARQV